MEKEEDARCVGDGSPEATHSTHEETLRIKSRNPRVITYKIRVFNHIMVYNIDEFNFMTFLQLHSASAPQIHQNRNFCKGVIN